MPPERSFGQWLKQRRTLLGLTQKGLAAQVPCSLSLIRKCELNARTVSRLMAKRLATALELDVHQRARFIEIACIGTAPIPQMLPRAPTVTPGWLPAQTTPLFGRVHDIAAVNRSFLEPDPRSQLQRRLLTLLGPPGVGKTRLSIEVAASLRLEFTDGVWFVALTSVPSAAQVDAAIARVLSVSVHADGDYHAALVEFLCTRHALLVLDNCEHVLAIRTLVVALLEACPHLYVLATSREPLRIRAERRFTVPPLSLPEQTQPDAVASAPATALFIERATAVMPEFVLDTATAESVTTICTQLDGLPLAIELAAARMDQHTPGALLAHLVRPFDALVDGPFDFPDHQRTLRRTIAWSYQLLSPAEQRSFARLGVFTGGCTVAAARAVGVGHLERLRACNLIHRQRDADGKLRYVLLETLRAFAREQLQVQSAIGAVFDQHMAYFAQLAAQAKPALRSDGATRWLQHLDADLDNLREAMRWSQTADGDATTGRIATALLDYWRSRGLFREGSDLLMRARDNENALSLAERAHLGYAVGFLLSQQGNPQAMHAFTQSLAIARALNDPVGTARVLTRLGMLARYPGNLERTLALLYESVVLLRIHPEPYELSIALNQIGMALIEHGDYPAAETACREGMYVARALGAQRQAAITEINLAEALCSQGDIPQAATHYQTVLAFAQRTHDRELHAEVLNGLGQLAIHYDDYSSAHTHHTESLALYQEMGISFGMVLARERLAYLALIHNDYALAEQYLIDVIPQACANFSIEQLTRSLIMQAVIRAQNQAGIQAAQLLGTAYGLSQQFSLRPDARTDALVQQATSVAIVQLRAPRFTVKHNIAQNTVSKHIPNVRFAHVYEAVQQIELAQVVAAATLM